MKPLALMIIFLLLAIQISALEVINTGVEGSSPVIYSDFIVFSGDGLKIYDTRTKEAKTISASGVNPSIFGFIVAFEQEQAISYYEINKGETKVLQAKGIEPNVYGRSIAFATPEAFHGIDFNLDGDTEDSIIRYYSLDNEVAVNTKSVGRNPAIWKNIIAFETSEKELEFDLNDDNDIEDLVIRYYDIATKNTVNTHITGHNPVIYDALITFLNENNEISYYNVNTAKALNTNTVANSFASFDEIMIYEYDGLIGSYFLPTKTKAKTEFYGTNPSIFEDKTVFSADEKLAGDLNNDGDSTDLVIRYIGSGDEDSDGVPDLADNCLNTTNPEQLDGDNDGAGDVCDVLAEEARAEAVPAPKEEEQVTEVKPDEKRKELPKTLTVTKKKSNKWKLAFAIIAIIGIAVAIGFYFPIWHRKKRKSFGF